MLAASFIFLFYSFLFSSFRCVLFCLIGFFSLTFTFLFKTRAIFSMSYCCLACRLEAQKKRRNTLISKWNGYFSCGPDLFLMPYRRVCEEERARNRRGNTCERNHAFRNLWNIVIVDCERRFCLGCGYVSHRRVRRAVATFEMESK